MQRVYYPEEWRRSGVSGSVARQKLWMRMWRPSSLWTNVQLSAPSLKKIHKPVKLQWEKSTYTVHSVLDENPDPDYSSGHSGSSTAACTEVSPCLPPGCISRECLQRSSIQLQKSGTLYLWTKDVKLIHGSATSALKGIQLNPEWSLSRICRP